MPVAAPINDKEIAILGGKYSGTDCSNDIFIFNIKTAKLKQVVNKNPIKFSSVINNATCYTPNSLVALPTDHQRMTRYYSLSGVLSAGYPSGPSFV